MATAGLSSPPAPEVEAPLLITGFQAFGGWAYNPTAIVAPAVAASLGIPHAILPVVMEAAPAALAAARAAHRPAFTLHLGLSGRAPLLQLERVAVNIADFRIPDAAGRQPRAQRLVDGAPDGLMTGIDLHDLASSVPGTAISNSAGTFLCNALYFHALLASARRSLFVHVPPTPDLRPPASRTEDGLPVLHGVPLEVQITAVESIARYLLARLESPA